MISESVIWTLLPNGVDPDTGDLCSTIYVSPRLRTGGGRAKLKEFPVFQHWPTALAGLSFAAYVDGLGGFELTLDPHRVAGPDPELWDLLFGGDEISVDEPDVKRLNERRLYSYPADVVANHVLELYSAVGAQYPTDHPPVQAALLTDLARDLGGLGDDRRGNGLYRELDDWFSADPTRGDRPGRFIPPRVAAKTRQSSFLLANRFYDRYHGSERLRDRRGEIDESKVPPGPERKELDFHTYIAAFGDYPQLLRRLGLAVDVRMHANPDIAKKEKYRLIVAGDAAPWMNAATATPFMHYRWYDKFFVPRTREDGRHDVADGQLMLKSDFYAVHQIDIDGSALKTTNVAATIARRIALVNQQGATMAPTTSSLPALRGGGLTVVRRNAASAVVVQFDHTASHADTEADGKRTELWADDVIRGFRYEAERDGDGRFRSLVDRVGTYRFHPPRAPVVPLDLPPDQGYVKGSSTTAVPKDPDLYLHEAIASWSGWSMVAPRPGGGVTTEDELDKEHTPLQRDPGIPLETSFTAAPGSLPRLRYGSSYRLRARTVDLAGNSVDPAMIDDQHASAPVTFKRWEPVPAPAVMPRRVDARVLDAAEATATAGYGEGESQMRMVIRSTAGLNVSDYLALPRIASLLNAAGQPYLATDSRWIVAPKTSQQMAEWHGVFDEAIGSGDTAKIQAAFEIACRESGLLPHVAPQETLTLPYLPDVSSRGVRFNRFPADPAIYRRVDWPTDTTNWWDRQPIRIVMAAGPAAAPVTPAGSPSAPKWDAGARTLTVSVPQAEMFTVRVSSAVDAEDLDLQGMYERILSEAGADANTRRHEALESRHWMLTPWVDLTFVHAVEKPLADPIVAVSNSGMQRSPGETFCVLQGAITNHAKSTGRLDIEAKWTEQVDDVREDLPADGVHAPLRQAQFSHVGDFLIEAFESDALVGRDDLTTPTGKGNTHLLRHEFGNTRHRAVDYHATATTRFREYFPPAVLDGTDDNGPLISRSGPTTRLIVPSSRRPDPPEIAYVIPTFRWTDEPLPKSPGGPTQGFLAGQRRTRHGGGLRVYLKRPWYSSGDGEQLGVILSDQPWLTWPVDQHVGIPVTTADQLRADTFLTEAASRGRVTLDGPESAPVVERFLRGAGVTAGQLGSQEKIAIRSGQFEGFSAITALMKIPGLVKLVTAGDKWRTKVGADPVFASGVVPTDGPYIHQFPLRSAVRGGIALAEAPSATVTVVGHTPKFDPARKLWYCDIEMDQGSSYQPFVRLGLCRYQPHSIDGCHISRVVRADFMQLLPNRTATVTPMADKRTTITLRGPSGFGRVGRDLVVAEAIAVTRTVTATVQRLPAGGDPDLGWTVVGQPAELKPSKAELSDVQWSGMLPAFVRESGSNYRVLLQEFEIHPTDPGHAEDPFDGTFDVTVAQGEFERNWTVRRRLVYADTFTL